MKLENEIKLLRERFIKKFCKQKGWNSNELTVNQMLIITKNQEYLKPKKESI
jgi:hypothetical protein